MAEARLPEPALLVVAAFSGHPPALCLAKERLTRSYGPVGLVSAAFAFNQTRYYETAMGTGLLKEFWAFADLVAPDRLAEVKRRTNELEGELATSKCYMTARPVNLDPGLLTLGKFMLATTKDQAHRIYLRDGIYAEVTLRFQAGAFEPWPWTYADYREPGVREFLREARDFYRRRLHETGAGAPGTG
jgi:hypothetical protein